MVRDLFREAMKSPHHALTIQVGAAQKMRFNFDLIIRVPVRERAWVREGTTFDDVHREIRRMQATEVYDAICDCGGQRAWWQILFDCQNWAHGELLWTFST